MCSSAPTCVLSRDCPPRGVPTISSEVEEMPPMGNHGHCCMVTSILPAITRSQDVEEGEPSRPEPYAPRFQPPAGKSSRSHRSSGWKTSKFFSKTMSSVEILRSLKKLSLTSAAGQEEQPRPRKSKSGQLKKRSSCGNDDQANDDDKAKSPRSPGGFRPLSKAMSLSEPGSTGRSGSSAGLGIVCRKEDLKAILCTATSSKKFPLASPKRRNRLRQTKSASFEPPVDESVRKEPVRRAGSEETRSRRFEYSETRRTDASLVTASEQQQQQVISTAVSADVDKTTISTPEPSSSPSPSVADPQRDKATAVKWDECEVVDAVIIGDAIESFLKGSMSMDNKRVSFRRQHSDRKTKSDG